MNGIELIFDFFEDHVRAAAQIQERRPLALGVLCFMLGGVSVFVAHAMTQHFAFLPFTWSALGLWIFTYVLVGFMMTAVLHILLDFAGSKGSAASLFVLLGMTSLAASLTIPLLLITRLLWSHSTWMTGTIFMAVWFLTLSLKSRSLQDTYQIGPGKAWAMLSVPYIAMVVGVIMAFFLALVGVTLELVKAFHQ
jgi:hypothetical protein